MHRLIRHLFWIFLLAVFPPLSPRTAAQPPRTENVIVVTLDGFRFQEFFGGADETLLDAKSGGVKDLPELKKRYWKDSTAERRQVLLPFFWNTIAVRARSSATPAAKHRPD